MKLQMVMIALYFAEDLKNIVLKTCTYVGRAAARIATKPIKPKASIVRRLGSHCVWIRAQRYYLVFRNAGLNSETCTDDDVRSLRSCLCSEYSDQEERNSPEWETKMAEMENEILELRHQVQRILLAQETKLLSASSSKDCSALQKSPKSDCAVSSSSTFAGPPPPPPLPSQPLLAPTQTVLVTVKTKRTLFEPEVDVTSGILEELKKPRVLRHVELSPGGRPKRTYAPETSVNAILLAKLKKRFEAIHSPSPSQDCYLSP